MAIPRYYLEELAAEKDTHSLPKVFREFNPKLLAALLDVQKTYPVFDANKDCRIYLSGSAINNVQVDDLDKFDIVVELQQEILEKITQYKLEQEGMKNQKRHPEYLLTDFRNDLHNALVARLKREDMIKKTKTIYIPANKNYAQNTEIEIIPVIATEESTEGVMFWDSAAERYFATYPQLHTQNLNKKDKETKGMLKKMIRIFRRLRNILIDNDILTTSDVSSYLIDCLLYNVPDILFNGNLEDITLKIINYLKVCNLRQFVYAHEKENLFDVPPESFNINRARFFTESLVFIWQKLDIYHPQEDELEEEDKV